jgi:hypothetical protein
MARRILRQKQVWALVVVVVLYTVFGFFIAPQIIKSQGLKAIADNLGRQATLEKVLVNPYSLSLTLQGFELKDPDGTAFVAFDDLYLNFQTSSLFRWAFTFKELRLDGPRIDLRRLPDGQPNFVDLIPDKSDEPPHPESTQEKGIPRLIVGDLQITGEAPNNRSHEAGAGSRRLHTAQSPSQRFYHPAGAWKVYARSHRTSPRPMGVVRDCIAGTVEIDGLVCACRHEAAGDLPCHQEPGQL